MIQFATPTDVARGLGLVLILLVPVASFLF